MRRPSSPRRLDIRSALVLLIATLVAVGVACLAHLSGQGLSAATGAAAVAFAAALPLAKATIR